MISELGVADAIIIGGGYSGTMLAAELSRRGVSSVIVDNSGRAGRGTAYSTPEEAHLLNVIAGRMGAWADRPGDFAEAVAAEGYRPEDYVPRRRYGEYLGKILDETTTSGLASVVAGNAVSAERGGDGWTIGLADGSRVRGKALILAQGNQAPQPLAFVRGISPEHFVNDPWSEVGRAAITRAAASGGDILVIGTGLTMVDVVLSLDEARHRGRIVAVSRRGLTPRAHADFDPVPVTLESVPQGSLLGLWRWLRQRAAETGWRAAVDSLRPHSHALWQSLSGPQKQRFMRHARPWWDVHRHRIAPEVVARIRRLIELSQLEIIAGRIVDAWTANGRLSVSINRRGKTAAVDHEFALAVNCTGPLGSISQSEDPLLRNLIETGVAKADELDLGLLVDGRSRIEGSDRVWAVGPLSKGKYWEITAVPDIRGQVADVARQVAEDLKR
jgi:uncharacterized NAD(P)/FAD-binding protein YdhS